MRGVLAMMAALAVACGGPVNEERTMDEQTTEAPPPAAAVAQVEEAPPPVATSFGGIPQRVTVREGEVWDFGAVQAYGFDAAGNFLGFIQGITLVSIEWAGIDIDPEPGCTIADTRLVCQRPNIPPSGGTAHLGVYRVTLGVPGLGSAEVQLVVMP